MTTTDTRTTDGGAPTLLPPTADVTTDVTTTEAGSSAPTLTEADVLVAAAVEATVPTMTPPDLLVEAAADGVTATWRNGVTIDALWSIDETRNAFVHVTGLGWRKLFNGRDGAYSALVTLASQARQTNRTVNLREESDGMVYEIYLW